MKALRRALKGRRFIVSPHSVCVAELIAAARRSIGYPKPYTVLKHAGTELSSSNFVRGCALLRKSAEVKQASRTTNKPRVADFVRNRPFTQSRSKSATQPHTNYLPVLYLLTSLDIACFLLLPWGSRCLFVSVRFQHVCLQLHLDFVRQATLFRELCWTPNPSPTMSRTQIRCNLTR